MRTKISCSLMMLLIIGGCIFFIQNTPVYAEGSFGSDIKSENQRTESRDKTGGRFILFGDIGGRINPQGISLSGGVNYRNVYQYSEKYKAESAYWQTGLGISVSPAYGQVGAHVEWMPWIFLPLRVQYDHYRFFGSYSSLLSFNSANAPFGDSAVKNRHDEETASGNRVMFQPTLQAKLDRVIFRNQTDIAYYMFSGRGPYFLEQEYYTLLKDGDYLISNRTQLLYQTWQRRGGETLLMGPYYEVTRTDAARITQQKIGGVLYWVPLDSIFGMDRPRLQMKGGYHLQDPDRQGQLFIAVSIGFDFDL
ncbi:MAG TPA: hypothetical protein VN328_00885 [Thermodesulfovibrionales bacterium]|nr:hypothetical protein [Thermodesulfovibrionales bacterium]